MSNTIGDYVLQLNSDWNGLSDIDRGSLQTYLENNRHLKPADAQKKAELIQNVARDGTITPEETKQLKDEFGSSFKNKKQFDSQFGAITGANQNALWKRQFQHLQLDNTIRRGVGHPTWLMDEAVIQGIPLKANTPIEFDASGRLTKGVLNEDTLIGDYFFSKGSEVELYPDGKILSGTLAGNYGTDFGDLPSGSSLRFDSNGKIFSAVLGQDATIQGYRFPKGSRLVFREDGNLYDAVLAGNLEIQNKTYHKNDWLRFDEDSQVITRS